MSTRIRTKTAWSFCLVFLSLSIATWAQGQTKDLGLVQDIRFGNTSAKFVLQTLAASEGLKVIFDESSKNYQDQAITFELHNITLESAIRIILLKQNLAARLTDDKTITVFLDYPKASQKFAEYKQWPEKSEIALAQGTSYGEMQDSEVHDEDFDALLGRLGKSLGLNFVFHSWVKTADKVTIDLRGLTAEQAIVNVLRQKKCVARIVEKNTIMVFNEIDAKYHRDRFDVYKPWPSIIGEQR